MEGREDTNAAQQGQAPQSNTSVPNQGTTQSSTVDNTVLMGVLAYLGILVIVPYLMAKENPIVKFHVKQGLVLLALEILIQIISIFMLTPFYFIWRILRLGLVILSIIGIVNVLQKKQTELPLVGQLAKHIPL